MSAPRFTFPALPPAPAEAPPACGSEDAALLAQVAAGQTDALKLLYDRRAGVLFALLVRILENDGEAAEVLQETFVAIWQRAGRFDADRSAPLTWMVMLARGLALDRRRARERRRGWIGAYEAEVASLEVETRTGFADLADRESRRQVADALGRLPEEQRHALELAFFRGWTHEDIARATGTPLGTIKARIRRGLGALRHHLRNFHD
ncbi:MAG: sigma-70 family RNA polymerase sigma factor [Limisphaerales bacterium]